MKLDFFINLLCRCFATKQLFCLVFFQVDFFFFLNYFKIYFILNFLHNHYFNYAFWFFRRNTPETARVRWTQKTSRKRRRWVVSNTRRSFTIRPWTVAARTPWPLLNYRNNWNRKKFHREYDENQHPFICCENFGFPNVTYPGRRADVSIMKVCSVVVAPLASESGPGRSTEIQNSYFHDIRYTWNIIFIWFLDKFYKYIYTIYIYYKIIILITTV